MKPLTLWYYINHQIQLSIREILHTDHNLMLKFWQIWVPFDTIRNINTTLPWHPPLLNSMTVTLYLIYKILSPLQWVRVACTFHVLTNQHYEEAGGLFVFFFLQFLKTRVPVMWTELAHTQTAVNFVRPCAFAIGFLSGLDTKQQLRQLRFEWKLASGFSPCSQTSLSALMEHTKC